MQKMKRKVGLMFAAMAAAAIGAAMVVSLAAAQAPPAPPSRFVGNVTVNGSPAPTNAVVEARIAGAACGSTTVFASGSEMRYTIDIPALDPVSNPGCGVDGSTVDFYVDGKKAGQTGSWKNYELTTLNLTVSATTPTVTATPGAPVTGNTGATDQGGSMPLIPLMLVTAALGMGGVALAAKARRI
ncbi:MAG: hypothetical protein AB7J35_20675 [Dehalococcoidia bacterium]